MTESQIVVSSNNNAVAVNNKVSVGALFAKANTKVIEYEGVNSYYHHIQCKCGTAGYFNIFKPVKPTEENKDNKVEFLNPEVIASHRIIGLEGDIIEFKFGFSQNIINANDVQEEENKYVRCQTSKLELFDANDNLVDKVNDSKPLTTEVFSPKKSAKEPKVPNPALTKELGAGYYSVLYGQVDPKYAERMGIPNVRTCVDCVKAGTNVFIDKAKSEEEVGNKYECKFSGDLIMLVRRVAYRTQDPENVMNSIVQWVDVSELGVEYLDKPAVFVIPLSRSDMYNEVGGDYGFHYNLNKLDYPKTLQPIGRLMKDVRKKLQERIIYGHTFEDINVTAPVLYQLPVQLMLVRLTKPIAAKTHVILGQLINNPEVQADAARRAEHAWYVYSYEKGISNGTLDESSDYPKYNPVYSSAPPALEEVKTEVVKSVEVEVEVQKTETSSGDFWDKLRKPNRE